MAGVKETALNFGPSGGLVGILSRRAGEDASESGGPAVVIPNAGIIHHVGPNRIHVRLARALAAAGTPSFRMDLPGIGDSRTLETSGSVQEESLAGLRAAFDVLERRGVAKRFAVFGICSGASNAFMAACGDERVVGIALVDPPRIFPTRKSEFLRLVRGAVRPAAWARLVAGRYGVADGFREHFRRRSDAAGTDSALQQSPQDEKRFTREQLERLAARGVRICYLITEGGRQRYKYRRQFLDAFPGLGLEPLTHAEILEGAQHTFPTEAGRSSLERVLSEWMEAWGPRAPDEESIAIVATE